MLIGVVTLPSVSLAASPNAEAKPASTEASAAVSTLHASAELATWARRTRDPVALVAAAKLRLTVGVKEGLGRLAGSAKPSTRQPVDMFEAEVLLRDATVLADGDKVLTALIADVRSAQARGVVSGPIRHRDEIRPQDTDNFKAVRFEAQREAAVYIQGDGKTDLDLKVVDEFGNTVCEQTGYSDRELCRWTPRFEGEFTIHIVNNGHAGNIYWLVTN
ncbi:hypothetical protein [Bosea sp. R86505]|uniref:hypothetical protein n=1 Tax=Bosea sp. R86505 TaxID=3101710 RepID=UPI003670D493